MLELCLVLCEANRGVVSDGAWQLPLLMRHCHRGQDESAERAMLAASEALGTDMGAGIRSGDKCCGLTSLSIFLNSKLKRSKCLWAEAVIPMWFFPPISDRQVKPYF